jgi:1-acyl-sn-glycerol-3-phosphate acyltransferase
MSAWLPAAPDRTLGNRLAYAFCRATIIVVSKLAWSVTALHAERMPKTGPVILAPTHRSLLDIPMMAYVTRRPARFMAKEELFRKPALARFISSMGGFPIKRGAADRAALATAFDALAIGSPLVVFPEGTRCHGPTVGHLEEGIAYMAMKAGATIIPIGVAGTEDIHESGRTLPHFTKIVVAVGEPIPVAKQAGRMDRDAMAALVTQVHVALQAQFDEANGALAKR